MKIAILAITMLILSGCAQLDGLTTKSVDRVADLIIGYCTTTDVYARTQLRARINAELAERGFNATAEIDCRNNQVPR